MGFISLRLIIPTTSSFSTTGRPLISSRSIISLVSIKDDSGLMVITSRIVKSPDLFTFLTCCTCSSIVMFRWITPKPPTWARAMAISNSVTVSIAELIMGVLISWFFETLLRVITSFDSTQDGPGIKRKSSNV